ncbi:CST complex subunit Ten1 [Bombardia bombarda]|uniref:CST complex subunit Ten1 n=1 Tax=Bombardia bombarda TaxID=252184 RepID=A0AA39WIJ4_9PEZI|nr:CST complex subunit Ten1 [Bombardia bombarda]
MSNGPLPSQLCLLSALPSRTVGEKVRFLGCVASYSLASGVLTLEHYRHPLDNNTAVRALVDVNLVLASLKADQTRIGEWVNVIGYITAIHPSTDAKASDNGGLRVQIQSLVVWSAGPLDVKQYEASMVALVGEHSNANGDGSPTNNALLRAAK